MRVPELVQLYRPLPFLAYAMKKSPRPLRIKFSKFYQIREATRDTSDPENWISVGFGLLTSGRLKSMTSLNQTKHITVPCSCDADTLAPRPALVSATSGLVFVDVQTNGLVDEAGITFDVPAISAGVFGLAAVGTVPQGRALARQRSVDSATRPAAAAARRQARRLRASATCLWAISTP